MFGLIGQKFDHAGNGYTVTEFVEKIKVVVMGELIGYNYRFKVECGNLFGNAAYFPRDRLMFFGGMRYVFDELPIIL